MFTERNVDSMNVHLWERDIFHVFYRLAGQCGDYPRMASLVLPVGKVQAEARSGVEHDSKRK